MHPLWPTYVNMKTRCYNKNSHAYKNYGGKGVKVCDRWLEPLAVGFWSFVEDMGPRPDGMTLDRIDPGGNYEPSNCRWASQFQQQGNRTNNNKVVGVSINNGRGAKWVASITVRRKVYSKRFRLKSDAIKQRKEWEAEYAY